MNRQFLCVFTLMSCLGLACGGQTVEFGGDAGKDAARDGQNGDAPDGGRADGDAAGMDAAGTDAAGTDAVGMDAAGTDAAGTDAPRTDGGGVDRGPDATGADANLDLANTDVQNVDLAADRASMDLVNSDLPPSCAQAVVALRTAGAFAVLAGPTVTNTGLTSVTGDLGTSPGTAVTGFGPGILVGTQHAGNPTAAQAQSDLTTAYNDAAGRTLCPISVTGNLGGRTLTPGLYKSTGSLEISSGDLVLDAQGDATAVFIFQMASTLTTTSGRQVMLRGGARAGNVFWQVGTSATLGSTSAFFGTIMADQAITLNTGATVDGRLLARIAAVNLDSNTIVRSAP